MRHPQIFWHLVITAVLCQATPALTCQLAPMAEQLLHPSVRADTPAYATTHYRKQLLRYVNGYYSDIAGDIMRGDGEYLDTLNVLMGSAGDSCTETYKTLLLGSNSGQSFALALWELRSADPGAIASATP